MLHLYKLQSIFIHTVIIWQQDEMFFFFSSISDRNIPMIFICPIDIIILL